MHESAIGCRHAFGIECPGSLAARQLRPLDDFHKVRKYTFSSVIEQETRLAVQRTAAGCRDQMSDQAPRDFRREQHRTRTRVELACVAARECALRCFRAYRARVRKILG